MQECLFNFLLPAFFLWKIMNCCLSPVKHILLVLTLIYEHICFYLRIKQIKLVLNEVIKFVSFTIQ